MDMQQFQAQFGESWSEWYDVLFASARTRWVEDRVVRGVSLFDQKWLRLKVDPKTGGKYPDKGEINIGSEQSQINKILVERAKQFIGYQVRVLVAKEPNGFLRLCWIGDLPQELENMLPNFEKGDGSEVDYLTGQQLKVPDNMQPQPLQQQAPQQPMQQPQPMQHPQPTPPPQPAPTPPLAAQQQQQQFQDPNQQPQQANFGYGQQ